MLILINLLFVEMEYIPYLNVLRVDNSTISSENLLGFN